MQWSPRADRALHHLAALQPGQARAVVRAVVDGCTGAVVSEHEQIPLATATTRIRTGPAGPPARLDAGGLSVREPGHREMNPALVALALPPAGFDLRVVSALGIEEEHAQGGMARVALLMRPRHLLVAAALLLAVAAGAWGGASLLDDGPDASLAGDTTVLWTDGQDRVGTASVVWRHSDRMPVVSVNQAPVGVEYTRRVYLAAGGSRDLGRWSASPPAGGTWVVPAPDGDLNSAALVTDSGAVRSQGRLR